MSLNSIRQLSQRPFVRGDGRSIPRYDAVVTHYRFNEGQAAVDGSINNVLLNVKDTPTIGDNIITNGGMDNFTGGIADNWTADVGVTTSEDTSEPDLGSGQRLSGCNGLSQAFYRDSADVIEADEIYVVTITIKKNGGTGNVQLHLPNMYGMASATYDIDPTTLANPVTMQFYIVAGTAGNTVAKVTADDASLDFTVFDFEMAKVSGENHMVMDFNIYDKSSRQALAYDFNGTDHHFYIADSRHTGLDFGSSPFTFGCMMKPDAANATFFSKRRNGGQFEYDFKLIVGANIRLQVSEDGSSTEEIVSNATITPPASEFSFVAAGMDLSIPMGRININGEEDSFTSSPDPLTVTSLHDNNYRAAIGCVFNNLGAPINFFNGQIGEMVIWKDTLLTAEQIQQSFNILRSSYGI